MSLVNTLIRQSTGSAHNIIFCRRLGSRSRVKSEATASFGKTKQATPGHQAMRVQRMTFPSSASVKKKQCLPLPWDVATVVNIVHSSAHT